MENFLMKISSILLLISFVKSELRPENVVAAINCGGDEYRDSKGIVYSKDEHFEAGQDSDFGTQFEIKLTQDQDLYQTERWHSETFSYKIPFTSNGKHVLVLKFSEVYFNSPNEKIFDVLLGNTVVIPHVDVFGKVGKAHALDEYVEFEIKDSKVYVKGKVADGAFLKDDKLLVITFRKSDRDNPKINAILIVKGNLGDTDFETYKEQLEELEKTKVEKERKQRDFQKKSNFHLDFEDFEDDFKDLYGKKSGSSFNFSSLILIGCILFGGFFVLKKTSVIDSESSSKVSEDDEEDEKDE